MALGVSRGQLAEDADRVAAYRQLGRCVQGRATPRDAAPPPSAPSTAPQTRSTTPFMSKKSTSRVPPLQCSAPWRIPSRHIRASAALHRPARIVRRSRTAGRRAAHAGGCTRPRPRGRAAATAAGRQSSPRAGWRSAPAVRIGANAAAASAPMNPNVTASEKPAPVITPRSRRARDVRGSTTGAGCQQRQEIVPGSDRSRSGAPLPPADRLRAARPLDGWRW